jgi:hypothetical protein
MRKIEEASSEKDDSYEEISFSGMHRRIYKFAQANNMDATLKAKLDETRQRMNRKQAGINSDRRNEDPVKREWARGKQRPANAERAQFRNSLTDEERSQIEDRIQQLVDENPALSPVNTQMPDGKTEPPTVSADILDEYYFLRDIVG